jgi:hypothetical protein
MLADRRGSVPGAAQARWHAREDSNPQPSDPKSDALSVELRARRSAALHSTGCPTSGQELSRLGRPGLSLFLQERQAALPSGTAMREPPTPSRTTRGPARCQDTEAKETRSYPLWHWPSNLPWGELGVSCASRALCCRGCCRRQELRPRHAQAAGRLCQGPRAPGHCAHLEVLAQHRASVGRPMRARRAQGALARSLTCPREAAPELQQRNLAQRRRTEHGARQLSERLGRPHRRLRWLHAGPGDALRCTGPRSSDDDRGSCH